MWAGTVTATHNCFGSNPCTDENIEQTGVTKFPGDMGPNKFIGCYRRTDEEGKKFWKCRARRCPGETKWSQEEHQCTEGGLAEIVAPENILRSDCRLNNPCTAELMATPGAPRKYLADASYGPRKYIKCTSKNGKEPRCVLRACEDGKIFVFKDQKCM